MARDTKTLATRALDLKQVPYETLVFPETIRDALGVADYLGLPPSMIYKTLVVVPVDPPGRPLLVMIGGDRSLDLKRTARAIGLKKVRMAHHDEAERLTGLRVGGISPLALLQRGFKVFLDDRARELEDAVVSAGKRGVNLRLKVADLVAMTQAHWIDASSGSSEQG